MKVMLLAALLVAATLGSSFSATLTVVYDKNWQLQYYVKDGQLFDTNWISQYYVRDDRVYDRDWQLRYYVKDGQLFDTDWLLRYYLREREVAEPAGK